MVTHKLNINTERVTDAVYRAIREAVLDNRFPPGSRIDQDELAAELGVSRTPIKDALAALASDGLVEIVPRKGTFVKSVVARDIDETFEIRLALELLAAERVIELRKDTSPLESHLRAMSIASQATDGPGEYWELNAKFHRALVTLSGNKRLIAIYGGLQANLQIARLHHQSDDWRARASLDGKEHERIVEAIKAGDVDRAREAIREHVLRGKSVVLQRLVTTADTDQPKPTEAE